MIRHLASIAEIVEDVDAAITFYRDVLGLEVEADPEQGYGLVKIDGVFHYGVWSRRAAAMSIYGDPEATDRVPLGFAVGFEVDDVAQAEATLAGKGLSFVQPTHTEPWGQITARFLTPSGAGAEISETPWARTAEEAAEYQRNR